MRQTYLGHTHQKPPWRGGPCMSPAIDEDGSGPSSSPIYLCDHRYAKVLIRNQRKPLLLERMKPTCRRLCGVLVAWLVSPYPASVKFTCWWSWVLSSKHRSEVVGLFVAMGGGDLSSFGCFWTTFFFGILWLSRKEKDVSNCGGWGGGATSLERERSFNGSLWMREGKEGKSWGRG